MRDPLGRRNPLSKFLDPDAALKQTVSRLPAKLGKGGGARASWRSVLVISMCLSFLLSFEPIQRHI